MLNLYRAADAFNTNLTKENNNTVINEQCIEKIMEAIGDKYQPLRNAFLERLSKIYTGFTFNLLTNPSMAEKPWAKAARTYFLNTYEKLGFWNGVAHVFVAPKTVLQRLMNWSQSQTVFNVNPGLPFVTAAIKAVVNFFKSAIQRPIEALTPDKPENMHLGRLLQLEPNTDAACRALEDYAHRNDFMKNPGELIDLLIEYKIKGYATERLENAIMERRFWPWTNASLAKSLVKAIQKHPKYQYQLSLAYPTLLAKLNEREQLQPPIKVKTPAEIFTDLMPENNTSAEEEPSVKTQKILMLALWLRTNSQQFFAAIVGMQPTQKKWDLIFTALITDAKKNQTTDIFLGTLEELLIRNGNMKKYFSAFLHATGKDEINTVYQMLVANNPIQKELFLTALSDNKIAQQFNRAIEGQGERNKETRAHFFNVLITQNSFETEENKALCLVVLQNQNFKVMVEDCLLKPENQLHQFFTSVISSAVQNGLNTPQEYALCLAMLTFKGGQKIFTDLTLEADTARLKRMQSLLKELYQKAEEITKDKKKQIQTQLHQWCEASGDDQQTGDVLSTADGQLTAYLAKMDAAFLVLEENICKQLKQREATGGKAPTLLTLMMPAKTPRLSDQGHRLICSLANMLAQNPPIMPLFIGQTQQSTYFFAAPDADRHQLVPKTANHTELAKMLTTYSCLLNAAAKSYHELIAQNLDFSDVTRQKIFDQAFENIKSEIEKIPGGAQVWRAFEDAFKREIEALKSQAIEGPRLQ